MESVPVCFPLGERVPGTPYRVLRRIAQGGMGVVYEVEHVTLGRRFVLKVMHDRLAHREDVVGRMHNEWRMLAKLEHPAIVSVTDAGRTRGGLPYYVMERLDGLTLGETLRERGPLPALEVAEMGLQILSGLEAAHGAGAIHRDIKPQNLFVTQRGVKILDFGVAKLRVQAAKVVTRAGLAIGTPRYMAPEQASGEAVDGRADVYATGLVLYELLFGRSPFAHHKEPAAVVEAQLTEIPERLDFLVPGFPEELADMLQRWLAKRPADRPASARAARQDLAALLPLLRELDLPPASSLQWPSQHEMPTVGPASASRVSSSTLASAAPPSARGRAVAGSSNTDSQTVGSAATEFAAPSAAPRVPVVKSHRTGARGANVVPEQPLGSESVTETYSFVEVAPAASRLGVPRTPVAKAQQGSVALAPGGGSQVGPVRDAKPPTCDPSKVGSTTFMLGTPALDPAGPDASVQPPNSAGEPRESLGRAGLSGVTAREDASVSADAAARVVGSRPPEHAAAYRPAEVRLTPVRASLSPVAGLSSAGPRLQLAVVVLALVVSFLGTGALLLRSSPSSSADKEAPAAERELPPTFGVRSPGTPGGVPLAEAPPPVTDESSPRPEGETAGNAPPLADAARQSGAPTPVQAPAPSVRNGTSSQVAPATRAVPSPPARRTPTATSRVPARTSQAKPPPPGASVEAEADPESSAGETPAVPLHEVWLDELPVRAPPKASSRQESERASPAKEPKADPNLPASGLW